MLDGDGQDAEHAFEKVKIVQCSVARQKGRNKASSDVADLRELP